MRHIWGSHVVNHSLTAARSGRTRLAIAFLAMASGLLVANPLQAAQATPGSSGPSSAPSRSRDLSALAESFVQVEIRVRQDRGESIGTVVGSAASITSREGEYLPALIDEERPLVMAGWLLENDTVILRDPAVPARAVESIAVRRGSHTVPARIVGLAIDQPALFLRLEKPLEGAKPLRFAAASAGAAAPGDPSTPGAPKQNAVVAHSSDAEFVLELTTISERRLHPTTPASASGSAPRVIIDRDGLRVAPGEGPVTEVTGVLFADGAAPAPLGDPLQWPRLDEAALDAARAAVKARADGCIVRATLHLRSPRTTRRDQMYGGMGMGGPDASTEIEALGVILSTGQALILASTAPSVTARLERIDLTLADGSVVPATFAGSLRDFGALVATPSAMPESCAGGLGLSTAEVQSHRGLLRFAAYASVVGRSRVVDLDHVRLSRFIRSWRNETFAIVFSEEDRAFVFDEEGKLILLPLSIRTTPSKRDRWDGGYSESGVMPASLIARALSNLDSAIDSANVPLSADDEGRTGWLGVMLQPLDPELARANGVADRTRDGEFGGLVTFVYPDSPAAKAGIEVGSILLAVRSPRDPNPIEVTVDEADLGFEGVFPWERLDELPEEYYDRIPAPWPTLEDALSRTLTELGMGSEYEVELVINGETRRTSLVVEQSPPHFDNAPRFEAPALGLTVRDVTVEVREFLQLEPDQPGVVIARLEPGKRASVAGLRPFEIIVEVDGTPVKDAAAFGALLEGKNDVRLVVRRAAVERVVRMTVE